MPIHPFDFPFLKVEATGNDFILIDLLDSNSRALFQKDFTAQPRSAWVRRWCDRTRSVGADGVLFVESDGLLDFKWDFYNRDGSSAEMCGNAARAVSLYMNLKTKKTTFRFGTRAGEIRSEVHSPQQIEIEMPPIKNSSWDVTEDEIKFDFVQAGVPHAVNEVNILADRAALKAEALKIKHLPRFEKDGTNVTFFRKISSRHIESLTFERGVEDFTLSCGTGAVAAAYAFLRGREAEEIQVDVPGGSLSVVFKSERPHLKGPAQIVFEAHLIKSI